MKRVALGVSVVIALALTAGSASAESAHKSPFYVQGSPLGTAIVFYPGSSVTIGGATYSTGGALAFYRVDAEFGFHLSGRADGLVFGIRQAILLGWGSGGITTARVGYDIPVALGEEMELTIGPYAHLGAAYPFSGGDAAFHLGLGVDGKLFFAHDLGLYLFVRPIELGFNINGNPAVPMLTFAAGLGFAF